MRSAFVFLIVIHAIIHLIGFIKAFFSTEINKQILGISKPIGALWLIAFMLFIAVAAAFLYTKKWFYSAFVAVCLSQILIIITWQDTKFASINNILILLVAILAFYKYRTDKIIDSE
ncbi:hypothetical protein [uncultured Polaribacter sp.]|uniref:hypothetical protein n=1 Tax=uncultured Polaribacter sp. TaxID=174711 RepID=UPI002616E214|nr:hypothetical protein [uncultured Polaribacter sp.]